MPTITFFLRSNKDRAQTKSLYCRISINGYPAKEFSTKEKLEPDHWDQEKQGYFSKDRKKNAYIRTLCESISYKLKQAALIMDDGTTTPEQLVSVLKRRKQPAPFNLLELIVMYIDDQRAKRAAGTIKNHEIKRGNLQLYEALAKTRFTPDSFDLPEAERFIQWFMAKNKTKNVTTANRNVLFYRNALQWSCRRGFIKTFELALFEGEKDPTRSPMYLTHDELIRVIGHQFKSKLLEHVKDLYLFQASTGLSYGDLWSGWNIKETPDGTVLYGTRHKRTGRQSEGQTFFVPLDNLAFVILDKYEGQLPRINNGTYNRILKELAAVMQINKPLNTHSGRKTFATMMDENGWSIESIAKMLGHRSIRTTETYYIGHSTKRIEREMAERRQAGA